MAETVTIPSVEIFQTGTYNGDTYSHDDLKAMLDAAPEVGFQPPVKLGHMGEKDTKALLKKEGLPAFGYVSNLRIKGKKILADLIDVPKRLADIIKKKGYSRVSAEIYWNYRKGSTTFPRVLKAVALLGAEIPAITDLKGLEALYAGIPYQVGPEAPAIQRYDEHENEYRIYFGGGLALKDKLTVNYRETTGTDERCGTCRFYAGARDAGSVGYCNIVSGEISTEFVCDLYEKSEAFIDAGEIESETAAVTQAGKGDEEKKKKGKNKDEDDGENKQYTVEKRGDEYCLISGTGAVLGCHPTREEAEAQERAIKAGDNSFTLTVEAVREICPECADHMVTANIKELKIALDAEDVYDADYAAGVADHKRRTVEELVEWIGKVGYDSCLKKLRSQKLCGYLKRRSDAKASHKASHKAGDPSGQQAQEHEPMTEKGNDQVISPAEVAELKALLEKQGEELREHKTAVGARDERIALLERQNREADVKKEAERLKTAGIIKPAQEVAFKQLLTHFKCGEKIVEYHDGKKGDIALDFVAFIETFPRPSVLQELSMGHIERDAGDVTTLTQAEAGQELVKKAKAYQAEHPDVEFSVCMKRARELHPDLANRYAGKTS